MKIITYFFVFGLILFYFQSYSQKALSTSYQFNTPYIFIKGKNFNKDTIAAKIKKNISDIESKKIDGIIHNLLKNNKNIFDSIVKIKSEILSYGTIQIETNYDIKAMDAKIQSLQKMIQKHRDNENKELSEINFKKIYICVLNDYPSISNNQQDLLDYVHNYIKNNSDIKRDFFSQLELKKDEFSKKIKESLNIRVELNTITSSVFTIDKKFIAIVKAALYPFPLKKAENNSNILNEKNVKPKIITINNFETLELELDVLMLKSDDDKNDFRKKIEAEAFLLLSENAYNEVKENFIRKKTKKIINENENELAFEMTARDNKINHLNSVITNINLKFNRGLKFDTLRILETIEKEQKAIKEIVLNFESTYNKMQQNIIGMSLRENINYASLDELAIQIYNRLIDFEKKYSVFIDYSELKEMTIIENKDQITDVYKKSENTKRGNYRQLDTMWVLLETSPSRNTYFVNSFAKFKFIDTFDDKNNKYMNTDNRTNNEIKQVGSVGLLEKIKMKETYINNSLYKSFFSIKDDGTVIINRYKHDGSFDGKYNFNIKDANYKVQANDSEILEIYCNDCISKDKPYFRVSLKCQNGVVDNIIKALDEVRNYLIIDSDVRLKEIYINKFLNKSFFLFHDDGTVIVYRYKNDGNFDGKYTYNIKEADYRIKTDDSESVEIFCNDCITKNNNTFIKISLKCYDGAVNIIINELYKVKQIYNSK